MPQMRLSRGQTAMTHILSVYPRVLVFSGIMLAMLIVLALVPGPSDATAISKPVMTTAGDNSRKVGPDDCRLDQHAYASTCTTQGRTIRVINF
jgi:hypothetical protein